MKRTIAVVCVTLAWAAIAWSDPKTADEWFKEGSTQYNLGDFDKAAEAFKQAFALETNDSKKPAYLYNVAQAYRQGQKCRDAVFFYKRFLSLKDSGMGKALSAETRQKTEELITEAEQCAKLAEATARKPPDGLSSDGSGSNGSGSAIGSGSSVGVGSGSAVGSGSGVGSGSAVGSGSGTKVATKDNKDEGDEGDEDNGVHKKTSNRPAFISARVLGGPAIIDTGGLSIPLETTFTAIAGYPLQLTKEISLDVGGAVTFTPMPYINNSNQMQVKETASFTELLANAGVTYAVTPKIGARGDLGLGVLMFGGLSAHSPFTQNGAPVTGELGMFALRISASVDYVLTKNVVATLAPLTLSYSPAETGLASDIKSFARVDILFGVGLKM